MKILKLSLKKLPFEVMVTGEKTSEYRLPTNWIMSRLLDKNGNKKHYDLVEFTNGYGNQRPSFICEYKDFYIINYGLHTEPYSNGFHVGFIPHGTVEIKLGKVLFKNKC